MLLWCHAGLAFAQQGGHIRGLVVDNEGFAIENATIVVSSQGDDANIEVQTGSDGRYTYGGLATGLYTITAVKDELGGEVFRIRVRDGQTVAVNFELEPGRRVAAYLSEAGEREALSRVFASGLEANRGGNFELAVEEFLRALEISPACIECHYNLAIAYSRLERLADAEMEFERVIILMPEYVAAYHGLSGILARQGRQDAAAEARSEANRIALEQLAAGQAMAENAVARGVTLLNAGSVADAVDRFEFAIGQNSNFAAAHYWLGVALQQLGRQPESQTAFERYLQIDPSGEHADDARQRLGDVRR